MKQTVLFYKHTGQRLIDNGLSDNALITYVALKSLCNTYMTTQVIALESIIYQLKQTLEIDKREVNNIKSGLSELESAGLIKILSSAKRLYEIDMSALVEDTTIELEEIQDGLFFDGINYVKKENTYTILSLSSIREIYSKGGGKIFRYLFVILNKLNMFWTNPDRVELSRVSKIDERTIDRYNNILVQSGILYIHKFTERYADSNKTISNLYGLAENKNKIVKDAKKYIKENYNILATHKIKDIKVKRGFDASPF